MNHHPPLTAETREQISLCEYELLIKLSRSLMIFSVLSCPHSTVFEITLAPDLPKQPIKLFNLLKSYAVGLFNCEDSRYPQTELADGRRGALATRIEELALENILRFEKGVRYSLRFHASLEQMMASVREELADHITKSGKPVGPPAESDRRALVDSYIESTRLRTGERITRTSIWTAAGYKSRSEFERWQRRDPQSSKAADRTFTRILAATRPLT